MEKTIKNDCHDLHQKTLEENGQHFGLFEASDRYLYCEEDRSIGWPLVNDFQES